MPSSMNLKSMSTANSVPCDSPKGEQHDASRLQQERATHRLHFVASSLASLSEESNIAYPIAIITLQLAVFVALVVVLAVPVYVEHWASGDLLLGYTTLITILATLLTTSTAGTLRKLWFVRTAFLSRRTAASSQIALRLLTNLGSLADQFQAWRISLTFLVVGLITTSVVTVLTPRAVIQVTKTSPGIIYTETVSDCINQLGQRSLSGSWFSWSISNGSTMAYDQSLGPGARSCEAGVALDFMNSQRPVFLPSGAAYTMNDVVIYQDAVGMPWAFDLDGVFGTVRNREFRWATNCVPVLKRNPVRCSPGGQIGLSESGEMWVSYGSCNMSQKLAVDPTAVPAAVKGACTQDHKLGTATILFGASNGNSNATSNATTVGYADVLHKAVLSDANGNSSKTFAAVCEVDLTDVVDFRLVNYSTFDPSETYSDPTINMFGYQAKSVSNSTCVIVDTDNDDDTRPLSTRDILNDQALVVGGGATWLLLAENMFHDGWFDTINYLLPENVVGDGAFPDSRTPLEDTLGLMTAMTMGLYWAGNGDQIAATYGFGERDYVSTSRGSQAYRRVQLGPGSGWGLVYLLPTLLTSASLLYHFIKSRADGKSLRYDVVEDGPAMDGPATDSTRMNWQEHRRDADAVEVRGQGGEGEEEAAAGGGGGEGGEEGEGGELEAAEAGGKGAGVEEEREGVKINERVLQEERDPSDESVREENVAAESSTVGAEQGAAQFGEESLTFDVNRYVPNEVPPRL